MGNSVSETRRDAYVSARRGAAAPAVARSNDEDSSTAAATSKSLNMISSVYENGSNSSNDGGSSGLHRLSQNNHYNDDQINNRSQSVRRRQQQQRRYVHEYDRSNGGMYYNRSISSSRSNEESAAAAAAKLENITTNASKSSPHVLLHKESMERSGEDGDNAAQTSAAFADNNFEVRVTNELRSLRKALYDESPDGLYMREIDRVVCTLVTHYKSVMEVSEDLAKLRNTHKMPFIVRMIDKIEPHIAEVKLLSSSNVNSNEIIDDDDDDDDDDANADSTASARQRRHTPNATAIIPKLLSMYCHLTSTIIAVDQSVAMVQKMKSDEASVTKFGTRPRFECAPSFVDVMLCMRDIFMAGAVADFVGRKQYGYAKSVQHAFSSALCDEHYLHNAHKIDAKDCGKRKRMNGNEYMYASLARYSRDRFERVRDKIYDDVEHEPLFSIVVPTRMLNARTRRRLQFESEPGEVAANALYDNRDRFECRRMLVMHYVKRDEPFSVASARHALLPVDDTLFAMLKRDGESDRGTNVRIAHLICENARCVAEVLHTACMNSQLLVYNYLRYVAPHVHQNRVGEDTMLALNRTRQGSSSSNNRRHLRRRRGDDSIINGELHKSENRPVVVKIVGVDAYGAYPPGRAHARASMKYTVLGTLALAKAHAGVTIEHMSGARAVALLSNNSLAKRYNLGNALQGPTLYEAAALTNTCANRRRAEAALERICMLVYCSAMNPLCNLFVLSHRVALTPSSKHLQHAMTVKEEAATVPFTLDMAHAWHPSLTAFLSANLRFVPTFDITLWTKNEDTMDFACADVRVDFFASSTLFTHDSISYSLNGRDLVVTFKLSVDTIKHNICQMSPVSTHRNMRTVRADNTEVYFPVHWRSSNVKDFAKRALDEAYGGADSSGRQLNCVDLRKARVYSYTQSQSASSYCVLVGCDTVDSLPIMSPTVTRASRRNRQHDRMQVHSQACVPSILRGCRVATDFAPANNASSVRWRDAERYRLINAVLTGDGENIHDVHEVAECSTNNVVLRARALDTFVDKRTNVECAQNICVEMIVRNINAQEFTHNLMSLFGFWSVNSIAHIQSLHAPRFDEYTVRQHEESLRSTRK